MYGEMIEKINKWNAFEKILFERKVGIRTVVKKKKLIGKKYLPSISITSLVFFLFITKIVKKSNKIGKKK